MATLLPEAPLILDSNYRNRPIKPQVKKIMKAPIQIIDPKPVELISPKISETIVPVENPEIPWKNLLTEETPHHSMAAQREWGLMIERMRGIAPETEWYFLWMSDALDDKNAISRWRGLMEQLMTSCHWHSPKFIEVIYANDFGTPSFTVYWKKSDLPPPFIKEPLDWRFLPTETKILNGIKMIYVGAMLSLKAGNA